MAKADPAGFRKHVDSLPALYTPGRIIVPSKKLDSQNERTLVLTAAVNEYDENQDRLVGIRKDAFVNVALREKEMATLTPDEIKNMKGGH
jgi:hypothetical protein